MIDNKLRWNRNKILSHDKLFNFVITERALGKTYGCKKWAIDDWLKKKKRTVWVMRYKTEIDDIRKECKFFEDILSAYPDYEFNIDTNTAYIREANTDNEWERFIFFKALSERSIKAISDPTVNKIIFDEFIPIPGVPYLPNEVEKFLEFYFTISRGERPVRAVFLGNAVTTVSPYITYFGMKMPPKGKIITGSEIAIEYAENRGFVDAMKSTRFGQLIKGTHYEKYAIENDTLIDLKTFVMDRPKTAQCRIKIKTYLADLYLWTAKPESLFISCKGDPAAPEWAFDNKSHNENTLNMSFQGSYAVRMLNNYYRLGQLYFDSQEAKAFFMATCAQLLKMK